MYPGLGLCCICCCVVVVVFIDSQVEADRARSRVESAGRLLIKQLSK
jgi:hypothetical protein